jgi:hypothetical protein
MSKLNRCRILTVLLALAISIIWMSAALAVDIPLLPAAYYGSITSTDTTPVEKGIVEAAVNGVTRGEIEAEDNQFGGGGGTDPKLIVSGSSADIGQEVEFSVDGIPAAATPKVKWRDGDIQEIELTVPYTLLGISAGDAVSLNIGQTQRLTVKRIYSNGDEVPFSAGLEFRSSNNAVAGVSNLGLITAIAPGKCKISIIDTKYGRRTEVDVNVSSGGGGSGGGDEPDSGLREDLKNLQDKLDEEAITPAQAAEELSKIVQNLASTGEFTAAEQEIISNAVKNIMERAGDVDDTKVSSHISEGRQQVSVDQETLVEKIREVARICDNLARTMEDANLNELGLAIPSNISIMAPSESGVRGTSLEIPKAVAQEAVDKKVGLIFNTGTVGFYLPAEVIGTLISTSEDANNLEISVQTVKEDLEDNGPEGMNLLGDLLDLNISVRNEEGLEFKPASYGSKIIVTISLAGIDLSQINPEKLVVYRQIERYNETTGQVETSWECVGGRISEDGKSIIFETDHTSVYAVFVSNITFKDIQKHWAKEQVEVLAARQIVKGLAPDTFGPEVSVTRAQFTAIVLRALGIDEKSGLNQTFIDVKPGTWYYGAVETAYAEGLVDGVGDGRFDPGRQISRQEMAVLIARALQQTGADKSIGFDEINNNLKRFKDRDEIAPWAQESVAKAVELGIITGRTQDTFVGKANATRAESAVMVYRMLKKAGHI